MENGSRPQKDPVIYSAMHAEKRRRKRRKIFSVVLAWLLVIVVVIAVAVSAVVIVMSAGGKSLRKNAQSNKPNLIMDEPEENVPEETAANSIDETVQTPTPTPAIVWQEGWVRHNGKIYEYNDEIMTFLVLGIDQKNPVKESASLAGGGQSDAIFLLIVDPTEKNVDILAINRNTMTEVQMYGLGPGGGNYPAYAQIAVQHAYGGGKELSCELTRDTVSQLLYDLPIHGYVSVNMGAIANLNDAIGGVEVTVLEDLTKVNKKWTKGTPVTLKGMDAFYYVKWRDTKIFKSADYRLERQKQYLSAFADKFKQATKEDITLPVKIYQELSKYMVTDITVDEVAYLAGELLDYNFSSDAIHTLEGETVMGEKYEEFYHDKDALKAQMIELFYKEVEQ